MYIADEFVSENVQKKSHEYVLSFVKKNRSNESTTETKMNEYLNVTN